MRLGIAIAVLWFAAAMAVVGGQGTEQPTSKPTDVPPTPKPSACDSEHATACQPYGATRCAIGDRMDIRFVVDIADANDFVLPQNHTHLNFNHITYAFCPVVDQLQAFTLEDSAVWAAGRRRDDGTAWNFTYGPNRTWLRVFGMGEIPDVGIPFDQDDSSVYLYQQVPEEVCKSTHAVVSFLVLNITMTNGFYRHTSDFHQAIQVGFSPTCNGNTCMFGNDQVCIGKSPGSLNCAKCAVSSEKLVSMDPHIFTSYYGTDKNGRRFMSGTDNPLNFEALSASNTFSKVQDSVNGATGNL